MKKPGREVREGVELGLNDLPTGRVRFSVKDEAGAPVRLVSIESIRDGRPIQGSVTANSSTGVYATNFEVGAHEITVRDPNGSGSWRGRVLVREGETTDVEVVLREAEEEK